MRALLPAGALVTRPGPARPTCCRAASPFRILHSQQHCAVGVRVHVLPQQRHLPHALPCQNLDLLEDGGGGPAALPAPAGVAHGGTLSTLSAAAVKDCVHTRCMYMGVITLYLRLRLWSACAMHTVASSPRWQGHLHCSPRWQGHLHCSPRWQGHLHCRDACVCSPGHGIAA
jgi:hypothetical protein